MRKPKIKRDVFVYADWEGVNGPILIGILHAELLRGKEIFSFEYNDECYVFEEKAETCSPLKKIVPFA